MWWRRLVDLEFGRGRLMVMSSCADRETQGLISLQMSFAQRRSYVG